MARTRRTSTEVLEDAFYDLSVSEQEQVLRTLTTLMRLKKRQKADSPARPKEEPVETLLTEASS